MVILNTEILLKGLIFPESPRWHDGKLWFSDFEKKAVMTVDLEGNNEIVVELQNSPSGLGWDPKGRLLIVSMQDKRLLRLDPEGLTEIANISNLATFNCNDMVVDTLGRAYIGNFGFDMWNEKPFHPAEIILISPDGNARVAANELAFPNGMVITPDGRTLIVGETFAARLTAFDIMDDGILKNRRIWANLKSVAPDGICLDEEGGIWVAAPGRGRVVRVVEGGKTTHKVKVTTQAYACMLGGPNRQTLFVATSKDNRIGYRGDGKIEMINVEVPGTGLP